MRCVFFVKGSYAKVTVIEEMWQYMQQSELSEIYMALFLGQHRPLEGALKIKLVQKKKKIFLKIEFFVFLRVDIEMRKPLLFIFGVSKETESRNQIKTEPKNRIIELISLVLVFVLYKSRFRF